MVNRRTFVKLGVGSLSASLTLPALAGKSALSSLSNSVAVYHNESEHGPAFFKQILGQGVEKFLIDEHLEPARKLQFYHRLVDQPTLVIGLTNETSAFELQMAAGDAFHFLMPEDYFSIDGGQYESLVAWAVAPVTELSRGKFL